jgi:hypothetical protein
VKDAYDRWWEWVEKPLGSHLMLPATIYNPVAALSEEDRRDRAKVNEAVARFQFPPWGQG